MFVTSPSQGLFSPFFFFMFEIPLMTLICLGGVAKVGGARKIFAVVFWGIYMALEYGIIT